MKRIFILVLLCLCLSAANALAAPPAFVIRNGDELKALPEFLQNENIIIVPDAEVSACDPGKGLLSLLSLTPEGVSRLWGMPETRKLDNYPKYSWGNGYMLTYAKTGQLVRIQYRPLSQVSLAFEATTLSHWGLYTTQPDEMLLDSIWNWSGGEGILFSIFWGKDGHQKSRIDFVAISFNDEKSGRAARSIDKPEERGSQFGFGTVIAYAAKEYHLADSSAKKEIIVLQRQRDLTEHLNEGFVFSDWEATVTDVRLKETSEPGGKLRANKSATVIRVGFEKISLQNSWQGAGAESAIMEGAPLFDLAVKLGKGQNVLVSGRFIKGKDGGPRETSLTEEGGMREPEFDVVFTDIKPKD